MLIYLKNHFIFRSLLLNMKSSQSDATSQLNHNSPIPLHYQLSEILRKELFQDKTSIQNIKVPTELEITQRFNVSRVTVRTALKTLVDEGLISRERGRGTFVKTNIAEKWAGQLMGFSETITLSGFTPGGKVLLKGKCMQLPQNISESLGTPSGWELKRLRYADHQAIGIEHSYFVPEIGAELEKADDLDNFVSYQYIENELKLPLKDAQQLITAVNATKEDSEMLGIKYRDALLYIERVTKSVDGQSIIYLQAKYRPDYFHYMINLKR